MGLKKLVGACVMGVAVVAGGCSTASIERRTLPAAIAHHESALPRFDVSAHVVVPESAAWNAAIAAVRNIAPVASADPSTPSIGTYYDYRASMSTGVRTQTRAWYAVRFNRDARRGLRGIVTGAAEQRSRTTCGDATSWAQTQADGESLRQRITAAIESRAAAPLDAFVFEGDPMALATQLAANSAPYEATLGVGADGLPFVEGAMASTAAERRQVVIEVQSRYRVTFVPADGGARVRVEGHLEHRTADDEVIGEWREADPNRVIEAVYSLLTEIAPVRDHVLPPEALDVALGVQPNEPSLDPAVDDLHGVMSLRVSMVVAPERRPDGSTWDEFADPPSPWAPNGPSPLYAPSASLMDAGRRAVSSGYPNAFDDFLRSLGSMAAQYRSPLPAPDLMVVVDSVNGRVTSQMVSEAFAATWGAAPLALSLSGETQLTISLWDADMGTDGERMAGGVVSAAQLVSSCRPLCLESDGGMIFVELLALRRDRDGPY